MLNDFLFWWCHQLLSLLPAVLRRKAGRRAASKLRLASTLDSLEAPGRSRGDPIQVFAVDPAGLASLRARFPGPTELELPPHRMLKHAVTLPLAAERDPGGVLRHEMDRVTPFGSDDLHWSWRILRRDRAAGTVLVQLLLVPRGPLRPILEAANRAGLQISALRAGADSIPLGAKTRQGGTLRASLVAACVLLALLAAAIPFAKQSLSFARVEQRIAALRPATAEAEALRRAIQVAAAGKDVLATQRDQSGSVLLMLGALTAGLGDDTFLTDLAFRARTVTISGTSTAAVKLIPALTAQAALSNTNFTAPVTRIDTSGREGFTLRTELAR